MRVEEIAEVVAIDVARDPAFDPEEVLEDPLEVLNICSSLITLLVDPSSLSSSSYSDPSQRIVALAHYSVQEYLMSDRLKQSPAKQYSMHETECHGVITLGSMKYLSQLQQPLTMENIRTSALALYAAECWTSHLMETRENCHELNQSVVDFMSTENPAYLTWIQLSDPDQDCTTNLSRCLEGLPPPLYLSLIHI